jgi:hypothetical protein
MNLPDSVTIRDHVLYRGVRGAGGVLLDLDRRSYHTLDEVGGSVWEALTETASVAQAVERLAGEYDVDRATLEEDVAHLIQQLSEAGVLSCVPAA